MLFCWCLTGWDVFFCELGSCSPIPFFLPPIAVGKLSCLLGKQTPKNSSSKPAPHVSHDPRSWKNLSKLLRLWLRETDWKYKHSLKDLGWWIVSEHIYVPRTHMTSIFEGKPVNPSKQGLFQPKQGSSGFPENILPVYPTYTLEENTLLWMDPPLALETPYPRLFRSSRYGSVVFHLNWWVWRTRFLKGRIWGTKTPRCFGLYCRITMDYWY